MSKDRAEFEKDAPVTFAEPTALEWRASSVESMTPSGCRVSIHRHGGDEGWSWWLTHPTPLGEVQLLSEYGSNLSFGEALAAAEAASDPAAIREYFLTRLPNAAPLPAPGARQ